ncbi:hypothetical protein JXB12_07660 [candidate division KSB1 bacterium]|nr:hypothetical protein [candidate division KSB1 bacterium]
MRRIVACMIVLLHVIFIDFNPSFSRDLLIDHQQQIIFLGNSITEMGEAPDGYVSLIRKMLATLYPEKRIFVLNAGISGHKSSDMSARFSRDVLQFKPDWVTISVGINDVWHDYLKKRPDLNHLQGVPLDEFTSYLNDMVRRAKSANTRVALFTTTVIMENLKSQENMTLVGYNKRIAEIARKNKCLLIDLNKAFHEALAPHQSATMNNSGILTTDGVHMNAAGNWLMARTILSAFGVPLERIDQSKSLIERLIAEHQRKNESSLSRYAECNHEIGAPRIDEKRIVFYGSSSVDLWNLADDFPGIPFINRGIGGETTRQMVHRFRQDVLSLKPEIVILFYGSCNDFWENNRMSPEETMLNTIRMVDMARWNRIKVAIGAISPVNDYIEGKDWVWSHPVDEVRALNEWLRSYCESQDLAYIDFFTAVADSNHKLVSEYTYDGMHCNDKGYASWKPLVIETLKQLEAWKP